MTTHKRVAFGAVIYLAGATAGAMFLPLRDLGIWPLVAWTALCVVLGLVIAEVKALSSAINNLPMDRAPVKVQSDHKWSRRR